MAVRFDADGEDYTQAIALGSQAAVTVACWVKISVDRNTWSTPWSVDNGTLDNLLIQTADDGVTMGMVVDGVTSQNMGAMTVGTWYFLCLAYSGQAGTLYHATASAASLSTVALSGGSGAVSAATLRIGESPWGGEWLNGAVAAVKFWTAQLSAVEVANERWQYLPRRTVNLQAFYPFHRAETTDYSGNGRTLSGGTGATTEDGPPISWRTGPGRLILPAAAGGTTAVGKDLGLQWHTRAAVGDTIQALWHTRQAVGDSAQAVWNVRQAVGDPIDLQWSVRQAVGDPVQLVWDTRAAVGDDVQLIWNVASALTAVGKDLGLVWHTRAAVGDDLQAVWNTRQVVADTVQAIWHTRATVGDAVQAIWHIRQAVGDQVQVRWDTRALAGDTVQLVWDVASDIIVVTPPDRTYTVPAEDRTYLVPKDDRTYLVEA